MKRILLLLAALLAMALPESAPAQTVTAGPIYIDSNGGVTDLGNGPLEFKAISGSGMIFTSSATGVGSGTTTAITLTASAAANPPCIGCAISGGTLVASSVVTAFNGTTGITVNTSQTIGASTPLSWGTACPSSVAGVKGAFMQVGQPPGDLPFYTLARLCGYSGYASGMSVLSFAIGAH